MRYVRLWKAAHLKGLKLDSGRLPKKELDADSVTLGVLFTLLSMTLLLLLEGWCK